jgi:CDP-diacylglycerol pyrophosphatase
MLKFELKDLIYIVVILVGGAVTYGRLTTNLTDAEKRIVSLETQLSTLKNNDNKQDIGFAVMEQKISTIKEQNDRILEILDPRTTDSRIGR